jgi:hypothetical protein
VRPRYGGGRLSALSHQGPLSVSILLLFRRLDEMEDGRSRAAGSPVAAWRSVTAFFSVEFMSTSSTDCREQHSCGPGPAATVIV